MNGAAREVEAVRWMLDQAPGWPASGFFGGASRVTVVPAECAFFQNARKGISVVSGADKSATIYRLPPKSAMPKGCAIAVQEGERVEGRLMSNAVRKISILRSCAAVSLFAATLIGAAPAVAKDAMTASKDQEPLRFGLVLPLSGSQALYGQDQVQAAEWAVKKINDEGGVNGRPLKMIVLDSRADPQLGIQAAKRLTSVEKVPVFVSGFSSVVKAIAPVANDSHIVQLSVGANSADIAKLGDYTYTTFPLADVDITAVANYSFKELGKRRAAVLYINNETGTVAAEIYRRVFTAAGGELVAFEAYDPNASDWTGPLLKVRASNPDIIHLQGLVSDTPPVIAQMRQLGLNQPVTSYSAAYNPVLIKQLGSAAENVIATSLAPGIEQPAVAAYVERWRKDKGRDPNGLPYTQYLYDAPYLVADVFASLLKKNEEITGESFRKEMLAIGTFSLPLTGAITIKSDHTVNKPVHLMQVKGGKWQLLATVK